MKKINFKQLCDLVANIDGLFESSYPVHFKVMNGNNVQYYECGLCDMSKEYVDTIYDGKFIDGEYLQYLSNDIHKDMACDVFLDVQQEDMMEYNNICDILRSNCDIDDNSKIYLYADSFSGAYRYYD